MSPHAVAIFLGPGAFDKTRGPAATVTFSIRGPAVLLCTIAPRPLGRRQAQKTTGYRALSLRPNMRGLCLPGIQCHGPRTPHNASAMEDQRPMNVGSPILSQGPKFPRQEF